MSWLGFDLKGGKELPWEGVPGRGTAGTKAGRTAMGKAEGQQLS